MATQVAAVLANLASRLQEDGSFYGGSDWSSGLWTVPEIVEYINSACKAFILDTQIKKELDPVAAVTGQRQYADTSDSMQMDRITFSNQALYRTKRIMLDRSNINWRTTNGMPRQYHQDQLPIKNFEVDKAPTSAMTGSGYSVTGATGTLRHMSGAITYNPIFFGQAGCGFFRYALGPIAYNANSPATGLLRTMLTGLTNFTVVATDLPADVSGPADYLDVPDFVVPYVQFWVLRIMLEKEGEGQDVALAKYCGARYDKGVQLFVRLLDSAADKVTQPTGVQK